MKYGYTIKDYFYEFSFKSNKNAWYKIWHRSKFARDIEDLIKDWRFRHWIEYADRHKLYVNINQDYIDRMLKRYGNKKK